MGWAAGILPEECGPFPKLDTLFMTFAAGWRGADALNTTMKSFLLKMMTMKR